MRLISDIPALEALFDAPLPTAIAKVTPRLTPLYRQWIGAARFCILSTVGPEGTDASPRGDDGPVVRIADDTTLWLPDWTGNNRIDSLRNIVRDGRVSLMFMVPGVLNVIRVNGTAVLTDEPAVTQSFAQGGRHPKLVVVITAREIYFQCAKALMRSGLWAGAPVPDLPRAGQFHKEANPDFDDTVYDTGYADYAKTRMW